MRQEGQIGDEYYHLRFPSEIMTPLGKFTEWERQSYEFSEYFISQIAPQYFQNICIPFPLLLRCASYAACTIQNDGFPHKRMHGIEVVSWDMEKRIHLGEIPNATRIYKT